MRSLFITFVPLIEGDGISKKIKAQYQSLQRCGMDIELAHFNDIDGKRQYHIASKEICMGSKLTTLLRFNLIYRELLEYIKDNRVEFVYIRYAMNSSRGFIQFLRRVKSLGVKIYLEIPTYPYDGEWVMSNPYHLYCSLRDRYYRRELSQLVDRVVTFSSDEYIFGVKCINISNAIDFESIKLRDKQPQHDYISFLAVATLTFWHGYDRMIRAIGEYYKQRTEAKPEIRLNIVGEGPALNDLQQLTRDMQLEQYVLFLGKRDGEALAAIFQDADICVGSLGRHRSNVREMRALKNIEYAAYGIPFIYSESNPDFDNMPYIYKVASDESMIDLKGVIEHFDTTKYTAAQIRESAKHLSWDNQMKKVTSEL